MNRSLKETLKRSYTARSLFFYTQIRQEKWEKLRTRVREIVSSEEFPKDKPGEVSVEAWKILQDKDIDPREIFCFPDIIEEKPDLIEYYRLIAALPEKGFGQLLRGEKRTPLNKARILNGIISEIVEAFPEGIIQTSRRVAVAEMSSGLQGSWVNKIGTGAAKAVKDIIVSYA